MKDHNLNTRIMAVIGTLLLWVPIIGVLLVSFYRLLREGLLNIDYLFPAQVFQIVLLGAALLLWSALRAHAFVRPIDWGIIVLLVSLAFALFAPGAWPVSLRTSAVILFDLADLYLGIIGFRLIRHIPAVSPPENPPDPLHSTSP